MSTETSDTWIFQAQPRGWDIDEFLDHVTAGRTSRDVNWLVTRHARSIAAGDTALIWRAGPAAGIVAIARVIGTVELLHDDKPAYRTPRAAQKFQGAKLRVPIRIESILPRPIPRARLQFHETLSNLAVLRSPQGTNFAVTPTEAHDLHRICEQQLDARRSYCDKGRNSFTVVAD